MQEWAEREVGTQLRPPASPPESSRAALQSWPQIEARKIEASPTRGGSPKMAGGAAPQSVLLPFPAPGRERSSGKTALPGLERSALRAGRSASGDHKPLTLIPKSPPPLWLLNKLCIEGWQKGVGSWGAMGPGVGAGGIVSPSHIPFTEEVTPGTALGAQRGSDGKTGQYGEGCVSLGGVRTSPWLRHQREEGVGWVGRAAPTAAGPRSALRWAGARVSGGLGFGSGCQDTARPSRTSLESLFPWNTPDQGQSGRAKSHYG